jgi:hypothetical protein
MLLQLIQNWQVSWMMYLFCLYVCYRIVLSSLTYIIFSYKQVSPSSRFSWEKSPSQSKHTLYYNCFLSYALASDFKRGKYHICLNGRWWCFLCILRVTKNCSMSQNKEVCVFLGVEIWFVNACIYVSVSISIAHLKLYRNNTTLHKGTSTWHWGNLEYICQGFEIQLAGVGVKIGCVGGGNAGISTIVVKLPNFDASTSWIVFQWQL